MIVRRVGMRQIMRLTWTSLEQKQQSSNLSPGDLLVSHYKQKNSEVKRCLGVHWMQQLWSRLKCWTIHNVNPEDSCVCALNGPVWFPLCSAAGPELLAHWHHFMILLVYQAPFPLRPLISLLLPAVCQTVLQLCTGWCCRDHILKEKFHIFSLV